MRSAADSDRGQRIEAEREFLLRSLDDLDAERAAGNIDEATYERLHSDYTARAAAALRDDDDPVVGGAARPPSRTRRFLTVLGIVGFAVVAALVLASALGGRLPGQTSSGNTATVSQAERQRSLERAVRARPADPQAHLALARFLLARQKYPGAFREFSEVIRLQPTNIEAQAYSGWLLYLSGLTDQAIPRFDAALAVDEAYPDAHFFKGVALYRGKNDAAAAIPEFQRYLTLVPDSPLADQVRELLAEAVAANPSTATPAQP